MMKNSKFRRILLLLACAVLLVSLSVGATLAYLTSTDEVENTFTVGNVEIKLDEKEVNKDGSLTGNRTDKGNADVHLLPGRKIDKDPTVTVLANSEDCYVRVKVTVDVSEGFKKPTDGGTNGTTSWEEVFKTWAERFAATYIRNDNLEGFNSKYWTVSTPSVEDSTINPAASTVTYILTYMNSDGTSIVAKQTSDAQLPAIFTHVEVDQYQDNDDLAKLKGMKIQVVAEAIQAEGFVDATAAWKAFEDQKELENQN